MNKGQNVGPKFYEIVSGRLSWSPHNPTKHERTSSSETRFHQETEFVNASFSLPLKVTTKLPLLESGETDLDQVFADTVQDEGSAPVFGTDDIFIQTL